MADVADSDQQVDVESAERAPASAWIHRRQTHRPEDDYDHEIRLVDTTAASEEPVNSDLQEMRANTSAEAQERRRDRVRASVRGEYNRQKWRKYQKERCDGSEGQMRDEAASEVDRTSKNTYGQSTVRRNYDWMREKIPRRPKAGRKAAAKKEEFEIDVLYENQRGWDFCGIPLYSDQSLLNFDPPAWQTRDFKDSPVNITNAQTPDPGWIWAWKSWYVDMSYDVDEQGWEYSFAFRYGFAWHGTRPWFHSFVRRRRWLRKRIKIKPKGRNTADDPLQAGHRLNVDYFTIHSAPREASSERVPYLAEAASASQNQRYSVVTSRSYASDDEAGSTYEEISNVNTLMKILKSATLDRKKLGAIRTFLRDAGPELHYLPDQIPEIMDLFVYQTSRRQLLHELQQAAGTDKYLPLPKGKPAATTADGADDIEAPSLSSDSAYLDTPSEKTSGLRTPDSSTPGDRTPRARTPTGLSRVPTPTIDSVTDQEQSLHRAIELARARVQHFEFWSDTKATMIEANELGVPPPPPSGGPEMMPVAGNRRPSSMPRQNSNGNGGKVDIKGIPTSAHIGETIGIARRATLEMQEKEAKRKAAESKNSPINAEILGDDNDFDENSPMDENLGATDSDAPLVTLEAVPEVAGETDGLRSDATDMAEGKGKEKEKF